jgi:hypothetical protein
LCSKAPRTTENGSWTPNGDGRENKGVISTVKDAQTTFCDGCEHFRAGVVN